ncbi:MAG: class I SAM-dependent methyltransferase [Myxococcales bacterium]|nr:class I SAM-dependent methyltransferase [Myxococcales bacterium]
MPSEKSIPDHTAVRVALWRALHVEIDPEPHVFNDTIGLQLANPGPDWRNRGDMIPQDSGMGRVSIITRARFVEDRVLEELERGVAQYVILGAGLDTFCQRRPELASRLRVFEIDHPDTQAWKRDRLKDLGYSAEAQPTFVPVDFEAGESWWAKLQAAGFNTAQPAIVASTGVSMYLTREAIVATLREVSALAPGSTLIMTYMLRHELLGEWERNLRVRIEAMAAESNTPFISFFSPQEICALAKECGFKSADYVSADELTERYLQALGLRQLQSEQLLVAKN